MQVPLAPGTVRLRVPSGSAASPPHAVNVRLGLQIVVAQKRVKKEDRNKSYVPRAFSESKYEMGKCWGLSTSMPKKVNPLPKVALALLARSRKLASRLCVLPAPTLPPFGWCACASLEKSGDE